LDSAGQEGVGGTPWSEAEVSAVVDSYFRMLASERAGVSYNKVEPAHDDGPPVGRFDRAQVAEHLRRARRGVDHGFLYPASAEIQPLGLGEDGILIPAPPISRQASVSKAEGGRKFSWT
jgi:hypothetical protein